jgi:hypothetical protein
MLVLVSSRPSLPEPIRQVLADIQCRLQSSSLEALVTNAGPIRGLFEEISSLLPDELVEALTPVAFIEYHRVRMMKALKRSADRAARNEQKAFIISAEQHSQEELARLNELKARPTQIQTRLEQLNKERDNLQYALVAKEQEIREEEAALAGTHHAINQQEAAWKSAMDRVLEVYEAFSSVEVPGSDDDDNAFLVDIEGIRLAAIDAIQTFL